MRELEWTQAVAVLFGAPLGMALVFWGDVIMKRIGSLPAFALHIAKSLGKRWGVLVLEKAKAEHGQDVTQVRSAYYVRIRHPQQGQREGECQTKGELTPLIQAMYREIVAENSGPKP